MKKWLQTDYKTIQSINLVDFSWEDLWRGRSEKKLLVLFIIFSFFVTFTVATTTTLFISKALIYVQ